MRSASDTTITLLAFGRRGYGLAAANLVDSLRHYGYTGTITVFTTDHLRTMIPEGVDVRTIQDTDPGILKLLLPDMITGPTLYIDADSIAIGAVTPLVEALTADGRDFITSVQGVGNATTPHIKYFQWALSSVVAAKEGFANDAPLYGIQSSWMFMRPGPALWAIAERALASYQTWTRKDLKHAWGGSKPDELFWGIGCTATGHDPSWDGEPMWFGSGVTDYQTIKEKHVLLTIPGQRQSMALRALRYYDSEVKRYSGHKSDYIFSDKHTNYKNTIAHGLHILRRQQA
jgi:hypothetical protein